MAITIPTARGFVYLAAVVDWFGRRVLSWRLSIAMQADLCIEAVEEAMGRFGRGRSSPAPTSKGSCSPRT